MIDCNVIRDLLPLYEDDALSAKTREIVKEHLNQCPACRQYCTRIHHIEHCFEAPEQPVNYHYSELAKRIRRSNLAAQAAGAVLAASAAVLVLRCLLDDRHEVSE